MAFLHKGLAAGRWFELSLAEQMGNIGSEVSRAANWQGRDEKLFWGAVWRALDLFDLTLADPRWRGRLREIARAREVFCDAVYGGRQYGTTFQNLQPYFDLFALAARNKVIYGEEKGKRKLREQLRQGAIHHTERDRQLAED